MRTIAPTNKLRFVERIVSTHDVETGYKVKILQQWWNYQKLSENNDGWIPIEGGEWRDIPLEKE
jgi:hypothetical protein